MKPVAAETARYFEAAAGMEPAIRASDANLYIDATIPGGLPRSVSRGQNRGRLRLWPVETHNLGKPGHQAQADFVNVHGVLLSGFERP
jgi:hypothetical protein